MKPSGIHLAGLLTFAGCAVAHAGTYVYVAVTEEDMVAVIDTSNDTVITKIPVAHEPAGVAASADGTHVYVGSIATNLISVVDTKSNTVVGTIAAAQAPLVFSFDAATRRLYVDDDDGLAVIDAESNTVVDRIDGPGAGPFCQGVVVNHAGSRIFATSQDQYHNGSIWIIDAASDKVLQRVPILPYPCGLLVSPDDRTIYIDLYEGPGVVQVLHLADLTQSMIGFTATNSDIGINRDGTTLYLPEGPQLLLFDLVNDQFGGELPMAPPSPPFTDSYTYGLAMSPDGGRLYIANSGANTITVEDTITPGFSHGITVGYFPNGLAMVSIVDQMPSSPLFTASVQRPAHPAFSRHEFPNFRRTDTGYDF